MYERRREAIRFISVALECSVYVAPNDPGMSVDELLEVGKRFNFLEGEMNDALADAQRQDLTAPRYWGQQRILSGRLALSQDFIVEDTPEYRSYDAFQHVCSTLRHLDRIAGAGRGRIDRSVLIERGVAAGIRRHDVEVAIAVLMIVERIVDKNGAIEFSTSGAQYALPSEQVEQMKKIGGYPPRRDDLRGPVYQAVKDVVSRRSDGRPTFAEPLDAFADALDDLGYSQFRMWWMQLVGELRRLDTTANPVAVCVTAAALVEGALTFVVKHARKLDLGVFKSKDFEGEPRTWKIDDLVKSAATGSDSAIFDHGTRILADALILARQRIHAGRMLSDYRQGVPDLRPEEARDAKATAEKVVRRVLDWLRKYPSAADAF